MTATDELRKLLDERGVKWEARTSPTGRIWTYWDAFNGHRVYASDNENGTVKIFGDWDVTPAQAIAATLGAGTCQLKPWEMERDTGFYDCMECGCGYVADVADWAEWRFCPNCGRRIVEVGE